MKVKKILFAFGTRPEAIKMAPVVNLLKAHPQQFKTVVCVTGQHREMLDQVLRIFRIEPDHDLNIMKPNQDLFDITARVLLGMREVLQQEKPDLVMVQGDTTTAFVAALAAFYLRIPIGHIEAGLRTHNKYSPFPEEKNRHMVSTVADYHFAPTEWAKANLLAEHYPAERIWVTGNTVIDALLEMSQQLDAAPQQIRWTDYFRQRWNIAIQPGAPRILLVTGHRRENFGEGFLNICRAISRIALAHPEMVIIYPVHLNPNVQTPVRSILGAVDNIHLIDPLDYEPFVFLMKQASLILTDSGGVQEEGPSLSKPVLVMRDTTERPEGVEAGTVKLVGTVEATIVTEALRLLEDPVEYEKMARTANPYGDGQAAQRIMRVLEEG